MRFLPWSFQNTRREFTEFREFTNLRRKISWKISDWIWWVLIGEILHLRLCNKSSGTSIMNEDSNWFLENDDLPGSHVHLNLYFWVVEFHKFHFPNNSSKPMLVCLKISSTPQNNYFQWKPGGGSCLLLASTTILTTIRNIEVVADWGCALENMYCFPNKTVRSSYCETSLEITLSSAFLGHRRGVSAASNKFLSWLCLVRNDRNINVKVGERK